MRTNDVFTNLQVGDNDLIGNKFNGHDLHLLLRERGVEAYHVVTNKISNDAYTFEANLSGENFAEQILHSRVFLTSDIVHLHLIDNTDFDIKILPLMTRLKPVVITLHEMFLFSGHCIQPGDCEKWKTMCVDCPYPDSPFASKRQDSAYQFVLKQQYIQQSNIAVIVASKWMEDRVCQSPVFAGKPVYRLPFGIDTDLFSSVDSTEAKKKLGVQEDAIVLFCRIGPFKGTEVLQEALQAIRSDRKIVLLVVGTDSRFRPVLPACIELRRYGWVRDDRLLAALYQACDLFLMPSESESFGMMAIEAMSCGKPVLCTTGTAVEEVIAAPECGIAVPPARFAHELQRLLDSPQERVERGRVSRAYVLRQYRRETYIDGMLAIYKQVMASFSPQPYTNIVVEQLSRVAGEFPQNTPLYQSFFWRITKPLRAAVKSMRMQKASVSERIRFIAEYMRTPSMDQLTNQEIRQSQYWKLMAPARLICESGRSLMKRASQQKQPSGKENQNE